MKNRIMGTKQEFEALQKFFESNLSSSVGYSVSRLYQNRGTSNLYRLYVDVMLPSGASGIDLLKGG